MLNWIFKYGLTPNTILNANITLIEDGEIISSDNKVADSR